MKLKSGFITYKVGESHVAVAVEEVGTALNGMIRSNDTAAYILQLLMEETTEEKITEALLAKYEVSRETAAADVREMKEQLKEAGYLDE